MYISTYKDKNYRLPDFIIPGAAKSGTTSLYQMLDQHPAIFFPPSKKEPFYFSFGGEAPDYSDTNFNRLPVWQTEDYLNLYQAARPDQICGDASTSYLYTYEKTITLLKKTYGEQYSKLKVIIILRNPIERAYSHYTYLIRNGFEKRNFRDAISEKGISEWRKKRWGFDYLAYGEYSKQVSAYLKTFPNTAVWLMEDMKNADLMMGEVFQFLELAPIEIKRAAKANPSGIPKNKRMVHFLRKNPLLKTIGKCLPSSMQKYWRARRDDIMSKMLEKPPMPEETKLHLRDFYRVDIENLQKILGRDLSHWLID